MTHQLNSECGFDCPIAELHGRTLDILERYPSLILSSRNHYVVQSFSQGREVFLDAVEKDNLLNKSQNHFGTDWVISPRLRLHRIRTFRDLRANWVLFDGSENLSNSQIQEIADWHVFVINWAMEHPGIAVPLIKIQILWLAKIVRSAKSNLSILSGKLLGMTLSDASIPVNILEDFCASDIKSARLRALENPSMPEATLESACLDPSSRIRIAASNNPSCTEDGQIMAVLLGDSDL